MMNQLELLTKHVMSAPAKPKNVVALKAYDDDEETKKLNEEIWYLENYFRGSCLAY